MKEKREENKKKRKIKRKKRIKKKEITLVGAYSDATESSHLVCRFQVSQEVLWFKPMSDAVHALLLTNCLKLQAIPTLWLPLLGLADYGRDQAVL